MTEQLANATPATFDAETFSALGTPRAAVRLPGRLFDGTVNMPVMHQAVKAFLANQRQGNATTKIRKFVTGGNQKPWKQKGTGRARQGSIRAPHWVGGGTVFGPIPAQLRAVRAASGACAGAQERVQRAGAHRGRQGDRRVPLRRRPARSGCSSCSTRSASPTAKC